MHITNPWVIFPQVCQPVFLPEKTHPKSFDPVAILQRTRLETSGIRMRFQKQRRLFMARACDGAGTAIDDFPSCCAKRSFSSYRRNNRFFVISERLMGEEGRLEVCILSLYPSCAGSRDKWGHIMWLGGTYSSDGGSAEAKWIECSR